MRLHAMRTSYLFRLLFLLVAFQGTTIADDLPTTIYTPMGSLVPNTYEMDQELSEGEIADENANVDSVYTLATRLADATRKYNCHAYAWHVTQGGGNVWIGYSTTTAEDIYWQDGSYIEQPGEANATKVSYVGSLADHSAVTTNQSGIHISKWAQGPLVRHPYNHSPFWPYSSGFKYYLKRLLVPGDYSTISAALDAASSGQTVYVRAGSHTVNTDATIRSTNTLEIASGATLNFTGNYMLRVEGKLLANGVTFTRSGGQWYGIDFYSGNSGSSLYGCTIQNAQYGVYVYNTNPSISHCTIRYNGTGIYGSYFYYSSVEWNLIEDNTYGVSCNQYSDLDISPSNIIRYNGWAVSADASSAPNLGSMTGYNSIYWNDYYDVYSSYSGTIYALGNWWGDYPPYPSIVGYVDYSSALSWNPNNWAKVSVGPQARSAITPDEGELRETDTLGIAEFDQARILFLKDQGSSITNALTSLISRYPNSLAGEKALVLLRAIDESASIDSKPMLSSIATEKAQTRLGSCAALLLLGAHAREGNYSEALSIAQSLINSTDPRVEKHALYNAGNIAWSFLGDKELGTGYFQTLVKKYPEDPLSMSCLSTMGLEPTPPPKSPSLEKIATPMANDLAAAYPNPFNPTTTIGYQLAAPGFVTLTVYDVIGRTVKILVSEIKGAGYHQASLNASSLASGVYYARLTVNDEIGNGVFTKVVELLLAK